MARLRRREIGLEWFRRWLTNKRKSREGEPLAEARWETLLKDEEGRPCTQERLFQMHLALANLYREANELKKEVAI